MVIFIFQYLIIYILVFNAEPANNQFSCECSVVNEHTNQVSLILDYASKLLDLIQEKENEVAATIESFAADSSGERSPVGINFIINSKFIF